MARIVRLTSGLLPDQALAAASRRLQHSLHQCSTSGTSVAVGSIQLTQQYAASLRTTLPFFCLSVSNHAVMKACLLCT